MKSRVANAGVLSARRLSRAALTAALAAGASLLCVRPAAAQSIMMTGGLGMTSGPVEYQGSDGVHVHIQGNGMLYQESANGWQPVCMIPCTTRVSPRGSYKLGGFLDKESQPFQFPRAPSLELMAHTASSLDFGNAILGWTFVGLAPAPVVLGGLYFGGTFGSGSAPTTTDRVLGGVMMGGGVALLALGIYLLVDGPKTTLTMPDGTRVARDPSPRMPAALRLTTTGLTF